MNPPNSHPSIPIHKAATTEKGPAVQTAEEPTPAVQTQSEPTPPAGSGSETQEQNNFRSWRVCDCRVVVLCTALAPLFDVCLHQKGHNGQNQQSCVLSQKIDSLFRGLEKQRDYRAEQPGQK